MSNTEKNKYNNNKPLFILEQTKWADLGQILFQVRTLSSVQLFNLNPKKEEVITENK